MSVAWAACKAAINFHHAELIWQLRESCIQSHILPRAHYTAREFFLRKDQPLKVLAKSLLLVRISPKVLLGRRVGVGGARKAIQWVPNASAVPINHMYSQSTFRQAPCCTSMTYMPRMSECWRWPFGTWWIGLQTRQARDSCAPCTIIARL